MIISYILLMDCFQNMSFPLLKFINEGDFLLHHSFYGPLILLIPISIHLFQIYVLINSLFYFYFLYNTSLLALIFQQQNLSIFIFLLIEDLKFFILFYYIIHCQFSFPQYIFQQLCFYLFRLVNLFLAKIFIFLFSALSLLIFIFFTFHHQTFFCLNLTLII